MNIQEAVVYIESLNFVVKPEEKRICIYERQNFFGDEVMLEDTYRNKTYIEADGIYWKYYRDGGLMDIGDSFIYRSTDLKKIVEMLVMSYRKSNILLNGWYFPFHLHPEWNIETISRLVSDAEHIEPQEFKNLEKYYNNIFENTSGSDDIKWYSCGDFEYGSYSRPDLRIILVLRPEYPEYIGMYTSDLNKMYITTYKKPSYKEGDIIALKYDNESNNLGAGELGEVRIVCLGVQPEYIVYIPTKDVLVNLGETEIELIDQPR